VAEKIIEDVANITPPDDASAKAAVTSVNGRIDGILQREGGERVFMIRDMMTDTMSSKFGIFRDEQNMQQGLGQIKKMQGRVSLASPQNKERQLNQALVRFLELEGMILLAEAVARGALAREESRGSHTRTDYPERDDRNFLKHTLVGLRDETMYVSYKPVTLGMFGPRERVY